MNLILHQRHWRSKLLNMSKPPIDTNWSYYRTQTKLREGIVFTCVCHSVLGRGYDVTSCLVPCSFRGEGGVCSRGEGTTPPNHKSGRYASYWNAFLYCKLFPENNYQSLTRLRAIRLHFFFNCSMSRLCWTSSSCFWNYILVWNKDSYDDWYFLFFHTQ